MFYVFIIDQTKLYISHTHTHPTHTHTPTSTHVHTLTHAYNIYVI